LHNARQSPATAEESERLIEDALIAALTGDRRDEYIAALAERAETMDEFGIRGFRSCTRGHESDGPVVLTPEEIREETAQLRELMSSRPR
jgi:hypothetical protein